MEEKLTLAEKINSQTVEELPFFFNNFVMQKSALEEEEGFYTTSCDTLFFLGKWLNRKGYSHYIVEPNLIQ